MQARALLVPRDDLLAYLFNVAEKAEVFVNGSSCGLPHRFSCDSVVRSSDGAGPCSCGATALYEAIHNTSVRQDVDEPDPGDEDERI